MRPRQYEGMFVFDASFAADLSKPEAEIRRILERAQAELVFCRKWDERRLAYEIRGRKRGTYILTYFTCRPEAIVGIERDAQLSERVLRLLVLRADRVTAERMGQFAPEKKTAAPPSEGVKPENARGTMEKAPQGEAIRNNADKVASPAGSKDGGDAVDL